MLKLSPQALMLGVQLRLKVIPFRAWDRKALVECPCWQYRVQWRAALTQKALTAPPLLRRATCRTMQVRVQMQFLKHTSALIAVVCKSRHWLSKP